jgi:hypothetical protein
MTETDLDPLIGRSLMANDVRGEHRRDGPHPRVLDAGLRHRGALAIALALLPKFGAMIAAIPVGVLGGAVTVLFGMIAAIGIHQVPRALRRGTGDASPPDPPGDATATPLAGSPADPPYAATASRARPDPE